MTAFTNHPAYLERANRFTLTPEAARQIEASGYRALELQRAMIAHIHNETVQHCREKHGWYLLPSWIELQLANAWTAHSADFMDIAEREYAAAMMAVAA